MNSLEGIQMGLPSHPRVRTRMPKGFQRPSIDLDGKGRAVKRDWKQIRADQVLEGDNVPGIGVITEIERFEGNDIEGRYWQPVLLRGGVGNMKVFGHDDQIFCFTAAKGGK